MARIVFDLDGTLIDSAPDIHGVANAVLGAEGYDPITLADTRRFIGNGASVFIDQMRAIRDIPDADHARLLDMFMARYEDAVHLTVLYEGVRDVLDHLVAQGHVLGLCTNKPTSPTRRVLAHMGLDPYFKIVLGGDSLPKRKPDPAPLRACFDALGDGPKIYVGDSEVDAQTAQAAQVPFMLFTRGYRKSPVEAVPHTVRFDLWSAVPELVTEVLHLST